MQYSQPEEERLMSQSKSIREAIKCLDTSTGHSLCLALTFTFLKKPFTFQPYLPSFPLSNGLPPSLHLSHSPQISVNEDISHGCKHSPFLRSIWQRGGEGRMGLTFCSFLAPLAAEASTT